MSAGDIGLLPRVVESGVTDSDIRDEAQQISGFMADCRLDVASGLIAATAAALRADEKVQSELRYQYSEGFSARANIAGDVVFLERALATIGDEQSATLSDSAAP